MPILLGQAVRWVLLFRKILDVYQVSTYAAVNLWLPAGHCAQLTLPAFWSLQRER